MHPSEAGDLLNGWQAQNYWTNGGFGPFASPWASGRLHDERLAKIIALMALDAARRRTAGRAREGRAASQTTRANIESISKFRARGEKRRKSLVAETFAA